MGRESVFLGTQNFTLRWRVALTLRGTVPSSARSSKRARETPWRQRRSTPTSPPPSCFLVGRRGQGRGGHQDSGEAGHGGLCLHQLLREDGVVVENVGQGGAMDQAAAGVVEDKDRVRAALGIPLIVSKL